jgi:hypothetical protein
MPEEERPRQQSWSRRAALRRALRKPVSAVDLYRIVFDLGGAKFDQGRPNPEAIDRTEALIGASFIEAGLTEVLKKKLKPQADDPDYKYLFDGSNDGPLATFSAKIRMSYALRIIDEQGRRDLDTIRHLRNYFAHSINDVGFRLPKLPRSANRYAPEIVGLFWKLAQGLIRDEMLRRRVTSMCSASYCIALCYRRRAIGFTTSRCKNNRLREASRLKGL